uniref:Serine/threonine-protein kinase BUR1 n=1 Tax=Blastobotrys adeninivorans TaxID=409370 RepID=A0A060TBJ1_BLAAD
MSRCFSGCSDVTKAYDKSERLGKGTFGEVYKAVHKDTGCVVAIKKLILDNEKEGFPLTALREIRILKQLDHENVVPLVDMAVERPEKATQRFSCYMVTPYMDHDLAGLLGRPGVVLSLATIKCYLQQILRGVAYLHAEKFLHRDMKTANILIDNSGRVRVADFGLARKYYEPAPTVGGGAGPGGRKYTALVVTRWYRAPELVLGEARYTTAVDLWGVGCVFGEMFTKYPILQGSSDMDQGHRIFRLMGSPNDDNMPGWDQLPGSQGMVFGPYRRELESVFSNLTPDALSLLSGLLDLNPQKRLTAIGALAHRFFTTDPLPAKPHEIPSFPSSHELSVQNSHRHPGDNRAPRADPSQHPNYDQNYSQNYNSYQNYHPQSYANESNGHNNRHNHHRHHHNHHNNRHRRRNNDRYRDEPYDNRRRQNNRRDEVPPYRKPRPGGGGGGDRANPNDIALPPYRRRGPPGDADSAPPYRRQQEPTLDYGS